MKPMEFGVKALRPLLLGMVLGGVAVAVWLPHRIEQPEVQPPAAEEPKIWPPPELQADSGWHYLKVDENGWSTGPVGSFQDLDGRLARLDTTGKELLIPIFPTVFAPMMDDKIYYDAILQSSIRPGDKVLVVGAGSGADAWVAWLKSQAPIYVVEVNPMAVANARATARLAGFSIKPIVGDIREAKLPDDFREFDFVLWNMPFVWNPRFSPEKRKIEENSFHDGDDGRILRSFLALLPSLLKKDGTAIVLNAPIAKDLIRLPGVTTRQDGDVMLFVIPNPPASSSE